MPDAVSTTENLDGLLLANSYSGDVDGVRKSLGHGAFIDMVEPTTGLSPLHVAIGRNHVDLVRYLLEQGATVRPDKSGRWPSTIAELCEADGEICDMIVDAEAELGIV